MTDDMIKLPLPTNQTIKGPRLISSGDQLEVEYDYEHDDGSTELAVICFQEVLAFEWRIEICTKAGDIVSSSEMRRSIRSPLLKETVNEWKERVVWADSQKKYQERLGGTDRFSHYTLWFDDVGTLNVIASRYLEGE